MVTTSEIDRGSWTDSDGERGKCEAESKGAPRLKDPFHIEGAPTWQHKDNAVDGIAVSAYEATLTYEQSKDTMLETRPDAILWHGTNSENEDLIINTDQYDAVHLLRQLPNGRVRAPSPSSSGMSDLPSDTEDMFFMSGEEASDYKRAKIKKYWENQRQARILAKDLRDEEYEEDAVVPHEDVRLEEMESDQLDLMKRTAKALKEAENPGLLEMKILANHGGDPRFSFLRTDDEQRWGRIWRELKEDATTAGRDGAHSDSRSKPTEKASVLVDYSSEDEEDKAESEDETSKQTKRKRKLQLAREWSRKRQEAQRKATEKL